MAIILLRTIIIFLSLTLFMRLLGKRQMGELELSEFVVSVLIADLAAHPLQDIGIPLLNGLIPIIVLFCCEIIISGIIMRSVKARGVLCGKPSLLIENGAIVQSEMMKNRLTIDELTVELRKKSITDISKIKYAILETDGTFNTILYPLEQPVTAGQMKVNVEDTGYPVIVINNGRVMSKNLEAAGHDMSWLKSQLKRHNAKTPADIFLMTVNSSGQVYLAAKEGMR